MDQSTIQALFLAAILDSARQLDVRLGAGNQHDLPEMAAKAAKEVVDTVPEGPQRDRMVALGRAAFASLVLEMVLAAETIPGYPPGVIGEQTLGLALQRKGPWPPFW